MSTLAEHIEILQGRREAIQPGQIQNVFLLWDDDQFRTAAFSLCTTHLDELCAAIAAGTPHGAREPAPNISRDQFYALADYIADNWAMRKYKLEDIVAIIASYAMEAPKFTAPAAAETSAQDARELISRFRKAILEDMTRNAGDEEYDEMRAAQKALFEALVAQQAREPADAKDAARVPMTAIVDEVSARFEGSASLMVPEDYADGYREAIEHIRAGIGQSAKEKQ